MTAPASPSSSMSPPQPQQLLFQHTQSASTYCQQVLTLVSFIVMTILIHSDSMFLKTKITCSHSNVIKLVAPKGSTVFLDIHFYHFSQKTGSRSVVITVVFLLIHQPDIPLRRPGNLRKEEKEEDGDFRQHDGRNRPLQE